MLENFQKEIIVFLMGMAPVSEARGAIPVGLLVFGFSTLKTYFLAISGNILPVLPLLIFFKKFSEFLIKKSVFFNNLFTWLFERTRKKHEDHFHKWKYAPLALFIFVAIPLPLTGAWSGVLAAIVFGIPTKEAMFSISGGVIAAGIIVTILTKIGIMTASGLFL